MDSTQYLKRNCCNRENLFFRKCLFIKGLSLIEWDRIRNWLWKHERRKYISWKCLSLFVVVILFLFWPVSSWQFFFPHLSSLLLKIMYFSLVVIRMGTILLLFLIKENKKQSVLRFSDKTILSLVYKAIWLFLVITNFFSPLFYPH